LSRFPWMGLSTKLVMENQRSEQGGGVPTSVVEKVQRHFGERKVDCERCVRSSSEQGACVCGG